MSIHALSQEGARLTAQLRLGEDASLRAQLAQLAQRIENEWQASDVERIEPLPHYLGSVSLASLGGFVKLIVRNTGGTIAIHKGWGHRLIHYTAEQQRNRP